jgi:predicted phage-related endonuclease
LGLFVAPTPGLLVHKDYPWLACTPDRLLLDAKTRKTALGLLEIKTAGFLNYREWVDGPPLNYAVQVQVQMGVTGLPYCYLVPLFGGNHMPQPFLVEFDKLAFQQITEITGAWWHEHVEARVPPPALLADLPVLPEVWPGDGSTAVLPQDVLDRLRLRKRMQQRIKQLEEAVDRIDLATKTNMKDATVATDLDGNVVATWTRYSRTGFDKKAFAKDHPDLAGKYTTTTTSQRFTVKRAAEEDDDE